MTEALKLLRAMLKEVEETNRLLTVLIAQNVPVYPTPAELGLVEQDEA